MFASASLEGNILLMLKILEEFFLFFPLPPLLSAAPQLVKVPSHFVVFFFLFNFLLIIVSGFLVHILQLRDSTRECPVNALCCTAWPAFYVC